MAEYMDGEILPVNPPAYTPSDKEVEVINRVFERFTDMQVERDKIRHEFDGRTITEYVNYSSDAYNGIVSEEIKSTKEDWQSLIWDHETRGKVKTIVAMVTGAKPFMSLIGVTKEDHAYAKDMLDVYEDSWFKENGSYKLYQQALSAAVKGTVIAEEYYDEEKYDEKEVISVDQETGQVKFKTKRKIRGGAGQVKTRIFPLLQFYPNENSPEIKHDCCTIERYTKKAFKNKFGKYPDADKVIEGVWADSFTDIKYKAITMRESEMVEVLKYYNEDFDEFVILSNGVWLNKQEGENISPLPFDHKRLPFAKTVFELADEDVFYGKSMPDLLGGEQETRNALIRLMVDQEILAINKPILLGMGVEIESYELYPGATHKMTGDITQARELDISGSNQSAFQLLNLLRTSTDVNTSIGPDSQGVHSGRKTAREAVILDENAKRITSTFQVFVYKLLFDRATLRIENIKQFYTTPIQNSAIKRKDGSKVQDSAGTEAREAKFREIPVIKPGKNPVWITMKPEMKGVNFQIRFVEDFEMAMNRSARVEMSKALLDEAKVNPLMNADESTIQYLEDLGKNPDRFYKKPSPEAMQFQGEQGVPPQNANPEQIAQ